MSTLVPDAQVVFLAVVLLAACTAKLAVRETALPDGDGWLLELRRSRALAVVVALAEGALGLALLVTEHPGVRLATAAWFAGATWVVGELRARVPEAGCGCFGGLSRTRIDRRGLLRAGACTLAAVGALFSAGPGLELTTGPGPTVLLVAVQLLLLAALSPELGTLLTRRRAPGVPCESRPSPLAETYQTLLTSPAWREHHDALTATAALDVWREGCWRLLVYPARVDGRDVEVVFAVSTAHRHRTVNAAVVAPETPARVRLPASADPVTV